MKTEAEIRASLKTTKAGLLRTVDTLISEIEDENYNDAAETCFTLMSNIVACEAGTRVLDN